MKYITITTEINIPQALSLDFFVMYEILSCLNPVNIHYETLLPIFKLFLLLLHQNKQRFHSTKHALQVAHFGNNIRKFF